MTTCRAMYVIITSITCIKAEVHVYTTTAHQSADAYQIFGVLTSVVCHTKYIVCHRHIWYVSGYQILDKSYIYLSMLLIYRQVAPKDQMAIAVST